MPVYSSRAVAFALGMSAKELDNLLSRHDIPGVAPGVSGRDRRVGIDAVVQVAISRQLRNALQCPWGMAIDYSAALKEHGELELSETLTLRLDLRLLLQQVQRSLGEASESLVRPRRGRPSAR